MSTTFEPHPRTNLLVLPRGCKTAAALDAAAEEEEEKDRGLPVGGRKAEAAAEEEEVDKDATAWTCRWRMVVVWSCKPEAAVVDAEEEQTNDLTTAW